MELYRDLELPSMKDILKKLESIESRLSFMNERENNVKYFGYPLLTKEVIEEVVKFIGGRRVLEVGCGSGFLAKLLQNAGVNVIATDNNWRNSLYNDKSNLFYQKLFTDVEELDAISAIDKYKEDVDIVLMSWPAYESPMAYEVLKLLIELDKPLIYIGEWWGGCNADDDFFELIDERCYTRNISKSYIPYYGIYDNIYAIEQFHSI